MIDYVNSDLFDKASVDKQFILQFDETQIVNSMLYNEQFSLTQSICSDSELRYGGCEASMVEFRVTKTNTEWAEEQEEFVAKIVLNKDYSNPLTIGTFKIASKKSTPDGNYKDIVAYDKMYDLNNTEISRWINGLAYPMPLKTFRKLLFEYLNCDYVETELINDNAIIYAPPNMYSELYAIDVLKDICELNACFGIINNENKFKFVTLNENNPKRTIYSNMYTRGSFQQEDYATTTIGGLFLRQKHTNKEVKYTIETNPYVLETRALYLGEDDTSLNTICSHFYSHVMHSSKYYPYSIKNAVGNFCVECGDNVELIMRDGEESVGSYIFERKIAGIQNLKDEYSAQGVPNYTYANQNSGGTINEATVEVSQKVLLLRCEEEDLLDNIPENTPDGTLVGTVSDIAYINEKAMLKNVGALYRYEKQYCICQGRTVRAFNEEGQKQSEIVLPSKWYQYNSYATDPTIWECYMFNPDAYRQDSSIPDVIYKNLIRLIVPKEFCDAYGKCNLDLLGDRFPNLSELIIETEGWYGGICSEKWGCPNLHTVRFTNLTTNTDYMFANSYVEHIYFNDSFSCGSLGTSNKIVQQLLSEKLTIHQFDDDDDLPAAAFYSGTVGGIQALGSRAIVSCPNLREIILPRSVIALYDSALVNIPKLEVVELRADDTQFRGNFSTEIDSSSIFLGCGNSFKIRCYSTNTSAIAWCNTNGIEVEIMEKE